MRRRGDWLVFGPGSILRRLDLCDELQWSVSFEKDTLAAVAPQGGPILHVDVEEGNADVYSASGRKLTSLTIPPDSRAAIHSVGWSMEEAPLMLQCGNNQPSAFLVGDLRSGSFEKFKISDPAKGASPIEVAIRPFGIFALFNGDGGNASSPSSPGNAASAASSMLNSTAGGEQSTILLHSLLLPENLPPEQYKHEIQDHIHSITCMEPVSRADLDCGKTLLYVCGVTREEGTSIPPSQRNYGIFTFDCETGDFEKMQVEFPDANMYCTKMSLCPESERFALLLQCGTLWIASANMEQVELEVKLGITFPPVQFQWCGGKFVHLLFHADKFETAATGGAGVGAGGEGEAGDDEEYIFPCHWSLLCPVPKESDDLPAGVSGEGAAAGLPTYELIKWDLDSPSGYIFATTEIDGLRIITDSSNILYENVPTCLESACHLRAATVSSCLCRALQDMHEIGSSLLDSAVRLDKLLSNRTSEAAPDTQIAVPNAATTLSDVLEELLDAAAAEFDPSAQAAFLKVVAEATRLLSKNKYATVSSENPSQIAAVSGGFTGVDADTLKDVCRRLRMLNDIRDSKKAGMLITMRQYQQLSGSTDKMMGAKEALVVIHRLVHHGDFLQAARLVHYFGTKLEMVALQWAISKVQNSVDNHETHTALSKALKQFPSVDTVDVANAAVAAENTSLAVDLLQTEKHSAAEVLLLLQLGYSDLAVEKALGSDDSELVSEILLKLITEFPKTQLVSALMRYPDPSQLMFMNVCQYLDSKEDLCREFCEHARLDSSFINLLLTKIFRKGLAENALLISKLRVESMDGEGGDGEGSSAGAGGETVEVEVRRFKPWKASDPPVAQVDVNTSADLQTLANQAGDEAGEKALTHHMYLQTEQQRLADAHDDMDLIGMPLLHTLRWMYKKGEDVIASEMISRFSVSDRAVILAKLDSWSEIGKWEGLDAITGIGRAGGGSGDSKKKSSSSSKKVDLPSGVLQQFIEVANTHGQHDRSVQFVGKLSNLAEKVEWFVKLDEFQRAADACAEEENGDMLRQLRRKSQNPQMQRYIDQAIANL